MKKNKLGAIYSNEQGMAILMVLTAITLLTLVLAEFTFDSKINKLRIYNQQDKIQARLNAEAGLKLTIAKLKLYKEAWNLLDKKKDLKNVIPMQKIESLITMPFIFPIPNGASKNIIQKQAIKEFSDGIILKGSLSVSVTPVSGFLNPNNLRIPEVAGNEEASNDEDDNSESVKDEKDSGKKTPQAYLEKELLNTLKNSLEKKREEDDLFNSMYGNLDPELLVKELKYYVSNDKDFQDEQRPEIERNYTNNNIIPKHAPLTSISELYLLEGWPDAIVDLIKDKLTIHQAAIIQVNKITDTQLKVLFPNITDDQSKEFFKYRDGSPKTNDEEENQPHQFSSEQDFKEAIVSKFNIVDEEIYNERIKEFDNAGLKIGVAGKLFKVISVGEFGRAKYTLTAYIDMPVKPVKIEKKKKDEKTVKPPKPPKGEDDEDDEDSAEGPKDSKPDEDSEKKKKPAPVELLEPRVVEITIS